jgi:hypothetical protein
VALNREYAMPWDEAKAELEWARMLRRRGCAGDDAAARERLDRARRQFERAGARGELKALRAADA